MTKNQLTTQTNNLITAQEVAGLNPAEVTTSKKPRPKDVVFYFMEKPNVV